MLIYILLLLYIVIAQLLYNTSLFRTQKSKNKLLFSIFIFIYLICALRASTVGRDLPGYETIYELTARVSWEDFDYVYFEKGYILLMKLCVAVGMSFQWFLALVYAIILVPVYVFIKKYSKDKILSALIFVCFQYLNFDLSGVRQAIATGIVMIAYMVMMESKRFPTLKYIVIVAIACLFHKGAFVCYIFLALSLIKSFNAFLLTITASSALILVLRSRIMVLIKTYLEKGSLNENAGLYIGTTLICTLLLAILFAIKVLSDKRKLTTGKNTDDMVSDERTSEVNVRMFITSLPIMFLFGAENAVRSYMLIHQVIIVELPNYIESFDAKTKLIAKIAVSTVFIALFTSNVLISGGFDIVPYKFFWQ